MSPRPVTSDAGRGGALRYPRIDYSGLPEKLQGGARRYIENCIEPGSFLSAVVCNDLREACACADDINRHHLFDIVLWFYNEAPEACWGSREKFTAWLAAGSPLTER